MSNLAQFAQRVAAGLAATVVTVVLLVSSFSTLPQGAAFMGILA